MQKNTENIDASNRHMKILQRIEIVPKLHYEDQEIFYWAKICQTLN